MGGARAHSDDLRSVIPALAGVMERHPEVVFAVMGDPAVKPLLAGLPPARVSFSDWGPLPDYYRFLENVDVGLAPLSPSPYDRCRGDIRFVEYAAHGVLAICAELDPYRDIVRPGQTGYLYRDVTELETVLERALAEGEVRAAIPARAARYVASERLERAHARERLGFYLAVAAQIGMTLGRGAARPPFPPPVAAPTSAPAPLTFAESRYFALGAGGDRSPAGGGGGPQADRSGRRGPPLLRRRGPAGPAQPPAAALARHALDARRGRRGARPRRSDQPALLPRALSARRAAARARRPNDAAAAFERARALAPGFGAPQERLGSSARRRDASTTPAGCTRRRPCRTAASPCRLPAWRRWPCARGRSTRRSACSSGRLANDPDLSLTNSLLGSAYVELKRFHQARVHLLRALEGADDRPAVLTALAKAEAGLGNNDAARAAIEEAQGAKPEAAPALPAGNPET